MAESNPADQQPTPPPETSAPTPLRFMNRPKAGDSNLTWALWYAMRGWRVFPVRVPTPDGGCTCTNPDCKDAGKHPRIKGWQRAATTNANSIRAWWDKYPNDNIGVATGPKSGLLVLDADGPEGRALIEQNGVPTCPRSRTGRPDGGEHLIFHWPIGIETSCNRVSVAPGLDTRGDGGFVVFAPSRHASGTRYEWVVWPDEVQPPDPPMWLVEKLTEGPQHRQAQQGDRNNAIFLLCRRLRVRGALPDIIEELAHRYNVAHMSPPLPVDEVRAAAESACSERYPAGPDPFETFRTPELPDPDLSLPDLRDAPLTDAGNAECFAAAYSAYFRYVPVWKRWLRWTGAVWAEDKTHSHRAAVFMLIRARGLASALEQDQNKREALESWARISDSQKGTEAMVKVAQVLPELVLASEVFDTKPWLLATPSETLELLTQTPRAPRREDYLTRVFGVSLDRDAKCPTWRKTLTELFDDPEMPGYFQRIAGYCLTGDTGENIFLILVGKGSNGKSTVVGILREMFEDLAVNARWATFDGEGRKGVGDDLAALRGARLVTVPEADEQATLNEAKVKMVSGGLDLITCRDLYGKDFSYRPEYKVMAMTNELPRIKSTTRGIWRRVKAITFPRVFQGSDIDKQLETKLRAEKAGIFNWALEGLQAYLDADRDLKEPESVTKAITEYKGQSSPVRRFIEQCLVFGEAEEVEAGSALFDAFLYFCDTENITHKLTKTVFSADFSNILEMDYKDKEISAPKQVTRNTKRPYIRTGVSVKPECVPIRMWE